MATDDLRRLLEIDRERKALDERIKKLNAEKEHITEMILDTWAEEGISSLKVDGSTIYLRRSVYARVLDRSRLVDALRESGHTDLLTANTNQLSSLLREWEEHDQPIPPEFDGVVGSFERIQLGVRNAG